MFVCVMYHTACRIFKIKGQILESKFSKATLKKLLKIEYLVSFSFIEINGRWLLALG